MGYITVEQLFIDLAIILYLNFSLIISDILEIKKKKKTLLNLVEEK